MQTSTDSYTTDTSGHERDAILSALAAFIRQRPGLEFGNYGDAASYRAELRDIGRDMNQARALLAAVSWRSGITADDLKNALRGAYSGRLSWDGVQLDYCTGQYWPTEYRRAVCAVLASALWAYTRDNMVAIDGRVDGDTIRARLRREFGRAIADRWFR